MINKDKPLHRLPEDKPIDLLYHLLYLIPIFSLLLYILIDLLTS